MSERDDGGYLESWWTASWVCPKCGHPAEGRDPLSELFTCHPCQLEWGLCDNVGGGPGEMVRNGRLRYMACRIEAAFERIWAKPGERLYWSEYA